MVPSTSFYVDHSTELSINGPPPVQHAGIRVRREEGEKTIFYHLNVPVELKERFDSLIECLDQHILKMLEESEWIPITK